MNHLEIKARRIAGHASGKPLVEGWHCHNCGWKLPVKGHFCSGACADDHALEKAEFLARDGK